MISHILIIDDRHSEVWFIERVLQKSGYDVASAFDGIEGLKKTEERTPDLIILDTVMPRMDGYQVYHRLQNNPDTDGIPVLFLTDKGEAYEKNKLAYAKRKTTAGKKNRLLGSLASKLGFLNKPVQADDLSRQAQCLLQAENVPAAREQENNGRPRILIIDDDVSLVQTVTKVLQEEGMEVVTAFNGLAGLNRVKEEMPDLIILDTIMPQFNGLQVLQYLRQHCRVPVLMIPGQSEADLLNKALVSGAESYLIKPFDTKDLVAFIKRKLNTVKS
ncbi:MAG: response regulator [Dehalococcoidales bacterium]